MAFYWSIPRFHLLIHGSTEKLYIRADFTISLCIAPYCVGLTIFGRSPYPFIHYYLVLPLNSYYVVVFFNCMALKFAFFETFCHQPLYTSLLCTFSSCLFHLFGRQVSALTISVKIPVLQIFAHFSSHRHPAMTQSMFSLMLPYLLLYWRQATRVAGITDLS